MKMRNIQVEKLKSLSRYFLTPIVLILFFLIFYKVYEDIKDKTVREFNNEQLILAKTASRGISSFFENYQSDLTFLAQRNNIIDFSDEGKMLLTYFYDTHKNMITAITRVDTHGVIMFTYPYNQSAVGRDISSQKHIQQVIATHKPIISDVFVSVQGYLAIALHVPIFKDKVFAGSLAILIPIDELGKQFLGKIGTRKNGNSWLVSENGIEIFCPVKRHTGKSLLETTPGKNAVEMLENIKTGNSGTGECIHQDLINVKKNKPDDMYFVFYRVPIGNTYWTILISYQEKEVYIALAQFRNRLICIFFLLFIAVSFYFYSLAKVQNVLKEEAKRKKAEKALKKSEEKFRRLFDDHVAVKLIIDPDTGKIIDANKSATDYYGWNCDELKQMNIDQINIHPPQEIKKNFEDVVSGKGFQFEFRHRLKDGTIRNVEVFSSKITIENKDVLHSIIHDITKRKEAEEALIRIAKEWQTTFDADADAIWLLDKDFRIVRLNKKAEQTFDLPSNQMIGKHCWEIVHNTTQPISGCPSLKASQSLTRETMEFQRDRRWFDVFVDPVLDENGNYSGFVHIISDITERKRAENELISAKEKAEEGDRLKTAFLQNMSHEIRTPMNAIMGFSSLLPENFNNLENLEKFSHIINLRCNDLLELINDILDIAKIESGQLSANNEECNLNELFSELNSYYESTQIRLSKQHISFSLHPPPGSNETSIITDPVKLRQIFINLINNAFKFTDSGKIEGGYIIDENHNPEFYVSDTGIGIPPDKHEKIFERFAQLNPGGNKIASGTGIGLSIVKGLIELLGGKIRIESEPGKGTTFYFSFPCKLLPESSGVNDSSVDDTIHHFPGKSVLVVEDDTYNASYLKEVLSVTGLTIIQTGLGNQAVQIAMTQSPDLILLDIRLPDISGYEAIRQIIQHNPAAKIIAQTAFAAPDDRESVLEAGCVDYISKPLKRGLLLALISKHL